MTGTPCGIVTGAACPIAWSSRSGSSMCLDAALGNDAGLCHVETANWTGTMACKMETRLTVDLEAQLCPKWLHETMHDPVPHWDLV
jgi:hypothetical protein